MVPPYVSQNSAFRKLTSEAW